MLKSNIDVFFVGVYEKNVNRQFFSELSTTL